MPSNKNELHKLILEHLAKQDTINEGQTKTLSEIGKCLVRQEESLKYHIKRTDLLEENVAMFREDFLPVKKHVDLINAGTKLLVVIVTLGAGIAGILKFFF